MVEFNIGDLIRTKEVLAEVINFGTNSSGDPSIITKTIESNNQFMEVGKILITSIESMEKRKNLWEFEIKVRKAEDVLAEWI